MNEKLNKIAQITVIAAGGALGSHLLFKYVAPLLAPFLIAAIFSAMLTPLARKIAKKAKLPYKLVTAMLVLLFYLIGLSVATAAVYRLVCEVGKLTEKLASEPEAVSHAIEGLAERLRSFGNNKLGFLTALFESDTVKSLGLNIDSLLPSLLSSLMSSLTSSFPAFAIGFVSKFPEAIMFGAAMILSTYYFTADGEKIRGFLVSVLPEFIKKRLPIVKKRLSEAFTGYAKAYFFIELITFCQIFLGFSILRINYAFLLSLLITAIDILPVIGTGTVLIPWSIISFINEKPNQGIGFLILYAAVLIFRQLAEPKIVSKKLGLHPLASLMSIYIGFSLCGILGIFILPTVAVLISALTGKAISSSTPN